MVTTGPRTALSARGSWARGEWRGAGVAVRLTVTRLRLSPAESLLLASKADGYWYSSGTSCRLFSRRYALNFFLASTMISRTLSSVHAVFAPPSSCFVHCVSPAILCMSISCPPSTESSAAISRGSIVPVWSRSVAMKAHVRFDSTSSSSCARSTKAHARPHR